MSRVLHIVPGTDDIANGMAVVARMLANEQGDAEVIDLKRGMRGKSIASQITGRSGVSPLREKGNVGFVQKRRDAPRIEPPSALASLGGYASPSQRCICNYDEVWVHGMWLPKEWLACWRALRAGKRLVRMTHGSLSPLYLRYQSPFKKWLVGPIERWCLRRCDRIVATCEAEKEWIEKYLGKRCPEIEVTDVKRFFKLEGGEAKENWRRGILTRQMGEQGATSVATLTRLEAASPNDSRAIHLLYLGRRHPLKGVAYLEAAVSDLNSNPVNPVNPVQNSSARLTTSALSASLGTRFARLGRFPMGRAHPQGAVTRLCVRFVSNAFGEELEKVWQWCDVLVLPTLSDNFGLVIAEALERGKRVITTDGAPAWGDGLTGLTGFTGLYSGYDRRLIYLKGYRDGTPEDRVRLLKSAIENLLSRASLTPPAAK